MVLFKKSNKACGGATSAHARLPGGLHNYRRAVVLAFVTRQSMLCKDQAVILFLSNVRASDRAPRHKPNPSEHAPAYKPLQPEDASSTWPWPSACKLKALLLVSLPVHSVFPSAHFCCAPIAFSLRAEWPTALGSSDIKNPSSDLLHWELSPQSPRVALNLPWVLGDPARAIHLASCCSSKPALGGPGGGGGTGVGGLCPPCSH